jgi:hypothetical protein
MSFACNRMPAAATDDAPLTQFQRDLADPAKYPIRKGMEIDEGAFRTAIAQAKDKHTGEVQRRFDASIAALPSGNVPSTSTHDERASLELPDDPDGREFGTMFWAIDADVERLVRRTASMYLSIAMTQAGFSMEKVSVWLAFFHTASPVTTRCEQSADSLAVCLDYGGMDVLVVDLVPHGHAWVCRRLRWMQQKAT